MRQLFGSKMKVGEEEATQSRRALGTMVNVTH